MKDRAHAWSLWGIAAAMSLSLAGCSTTVTRPRPVEPVPAPAPAPPEAQGGERPAMKFHATAYTIEGRTASGTRTHQGIVASDPAVLPFGTRIRVRDAGAYDGEYIVTDTGRKIDGHEIDIYLANDAEAKRFGNRTVTVEVLEYGSGKRVHAK